MNILFLYFRINIKFYLGCSITFEFYSFILLSLCYFILSRVNYLSIRIVLDEFTLFSITTEVILSYPPL